MTAAERPVKKGGRATLERLSAFLSAHARVLLVLAAVAPFVPGLCQFVQRGIPDVLFTGDGAALEIRMLHASHATQLLGPYSRLQWSHPGPLFFYLALPLYEAFHHRGPAINLFAFVANLACVVALTLSARRLLGNAFAFAVAVLLALYEGGAAPFELSSEWNPVVPILPLALLSFLCARLSLGAIHLLPLFAFLASAIVQTHIGFAPIVLVLSGLVVVNTAGLGLALRLSSAAPQPEPLSTRVMRRRLIRTLALTSGALVVSWLPPLIDVATHHPSNFTLLWNFFSASHPAQHPWSVVIDVVARQLALQPLAVANVFGWTGTPSMPIVMVLGAAQVLAPAMALATARRRADEPMMVLSAIALAEIAASVAAVRAIRGEIYPHLVSWISVVGVVSTAAFVAWMLASAMSWRAGLGAKAAALTAALALLGLSVLAEMQHVRVFRSRDENAERLAGGVERYLRAEHVAPPLLRIASHDTWPTAAAVVLSLYKHSVPFFVEQSWLFMMGHQLAAPSRDHPWLLIGDHSLYEQGLARRDLHLAASAGGVYAFVGDPGYLHDHRLEMHAALVSATGIRGDIELVLDGVATPDGTRWDSSASVVLESTASAIEVAVPNADVNGLYVSIDSDDLYSIACMREGEARDMGNVRSTTNFTRVGMGTTLLFWDDLRSCQSVRIRAKEGDGHYSVGAIGFLKG